MKTNHAGSPSEEQLEALRSLSKEQIQQLRDGHSVEAANGLVLSPSGKSVFAAGDTFGVLAVTRSRSKPRLYEAWKESRKELGRLLDAAEIAPDVRRAIHEYDRATQALLNSASKIAKAREQALQQTIDLASALPDAIVSGLASAKARARHKADPKRAAKLNALELWKEWQDGKHPKIRRVADFAREVMERWPVLTNSGTIEQWSAKWSKQRRAGGIPTC